MVYFCVYVSIRLLQQALYFCFYFHLHFSSFKKKGSENSSPIEVGGSYIIYGQMINENIVFAMKGVRIRSEIKSD